MLKTPVHQSDFKTNSKVCTIEVKVRRGRAPPRNQEVMGSNRQSHWAFFSYFLFRLRQNVLAQFRQVGVSVDDNEQISVHFFKMLPSCPNLT